MTTQPMTRGTKDTTARISKDETARLRSLMRGALVVPGDGEYDVARRIYNGAVDRRPVAVARCADVADVMTAVNFARQNKLPLAVRCGGHNPNGFATCDDGVVVDLTPMRSVHVDPERRLARAEGGCRWSDYDHATHAFGLASPGGLVSSTGVGGLTLGGGIGYLTRAYGLSIDNLVSADVVLADGTFVTASESSHDDLFWALRGGGGNFGVVTSFEFRLHPVSEVLAGPVLYPLESLREAMKMYREYIAKAPNEMNAFFAVLMVPPAPGFPTALHNKVVCGVVTCYAGDPARGADVMKPLRSFGPPLLDGVSVMPFPALQHMFDPLLPPGMHHYWKADFANQLTDAAIEVHAVYGPRIPNPSSAMHIYPIDGAAHQVSRNATAFSYRDASFSPVIAAMYTNPAETAKHVAWVREYWNALHPHSAGAGYVNFNMDETGDRVRAAYRDNYDRLVAIKKKYDPTNLFHLNQNIPPA